MKKYLLILIVLLLNITNVSAVTSDKIPETLGFGSNDIWNMDYLGAYVDGTDYNIAYVTYKPNGKVAFCIEPNIMMYPDKEYRIESYTSENLQALAEVYLAFEALGKPRDLYATAQLLMWERLGIHHTIDGKSAYDLGADKILNKIEEIKPSIRPHFDMKTDYPFNELIRIKDQNGLINHDYEIVEYSEGLSDVRIEGDELTFRITEVLPVNKAIRIEPKGHLKASDNLAAGEIYLASGSQSLFSYSSELPKRYEGLELNFKHTTGDLVINKNDEWGSQIKEGISFKIQCLKDGYENLILNDTNNEFDIIDGQLEVLDLLPPGEYQISETKIPYQYIEPLTFKANVQANKLVEYDLRNLNREIAFNVIKRQGKSDYLLNNTKFSLYDISKPLDNSNQEIELINEKGNHRKVTKPSQNENKKYPISTIIVAKQNHQINLDKILKSKFDLNLLIDEHKCAKVMQKSYCFKENHLYQGFGLKKSKHKITQEIQDTKLHYGDEYKPLTSLEIDNQVITDLHLISDYEDIPGQHLMVYQFDFKGKAMLCLQPISFENDVDLTNSELYEIKRTYQVGIINDDNKVIKENVQCFEGIKIQEHLTGQGSIQVVHPLKHNYYIPNTLINLYQKDNELVGEFKSNELGYIDVSELKKGDYYYLINGRKVNVSLTKNDGEVRLPLLKQDRNYLLIEELPTIGYRYGTYNPITFIAGKLSESQKMPAIFVNNELSSFDFKLFKSNHAKSLLLNGAEFDTYLKDVKLDRVSDLEEVSEIEEEKTLYGHFITGCLNINREFVEFVKEDEKDSWVYEIYRYSEPQLYDYRLTEELIVGMEFMQELPYTEVANIEGLSEGTYLVKLRKQDSKKYLEKTFDYQVIDGGIDLKNIPYNQALEIIETKAPMGYYANSEPFNVEPNLEKMKHQLYNYRINEMIIINTSVNE